MFREFLTGSDGREVSTTMAFVGMLRQMLRDPEIGKLVVPVVPDEARTFGMESLFRQVGIYSSRGQLYEPVDLHTLLYYKEAKDGQILEEGITEAGSMASFIAAGSAYATHGINTIPFFIYYSMFGLQRISDFIWAAADMRCRGFLLGGTAGERRWPAKACSTRMATATFWRCRFPRCGPTIRRLPMRLPSSSRTASGACIKTARSIFYYITVMNEAYAMPPMPAGPEVKDGILKGMYKYRASENKKSKLRAQLFGSGAILREALRAQEILEQRYGVSADVWSVTSYKALYSDGIDTERWNLLHPSGKAESSVYFQMSRAGAGRSGRRDGLYEGASQSRQPVDAPASRGARNRWVWPQREPRRAP